MKPWLKPLWTRMKRLWAWAFHDPDDDPKTPEDAHERDVWRSIK